jgi:hypothetical protein
VILRGSPRSASEKVVYKWHVLFRSYGEEALKQFALQNLIVKSLTRGRRAAHFRTIGRRLSLDAHLRFGRPNQLLQLPRIYEKTASVTGCIMHRRAKSKLAIGTWRLTLPPVLPRSQDLGSLT